MRRRFTISKGFLLIVALLLYLDGQGVVLWYLVAMSLHELGHLAAIYCLGGGIQSLRLTVAGAEMKLDMSRQLSYGREVLAIFAGPFISLCAAWFSSRFGWYLFAAANLSFGVINLLPIGILDGGRILACVLNMNWPNNADAVEHWISVAFSGVLLGLGWTAWRRWGNLTLFLASAWLASAEIKK